MMYKIEFYTTEIQKNNLQGFQELANFETFKFIKEALSNNVHLKIGFDRIDGGNGICQLEQWIEARDRRENENNILQILVNNNAIQEINIKINPMAKKILPNKPTKPVIKEPVKKPLLPQPSKKPLIKVPSPTKPLLKV